MVGVGVEQMLELWCTELHRVKAQLRSLFAHPSVASSAAAFLDGLLGPERRKTGWMRGGRRGSGALAPAGGARPQPLERGCPARHGVRVCGRDAHGTRSRAGDR